MATAATTLQAALHCAKCDAKANFVEEYSGSPGFAQGEIVLISCPSLHCKMKRPWIYCKSCKNRFSIKSLKNHAKRRNHIENHLRLYPPPAPVPALEHPTPVALAASVFDNREPTETEVMDEDIQLTVDDIDEIMDRELEATYIQNGESPMEVCNPPEVQEKIDSSVALLPHVRMEGNEWLAKAFAHVPRATVQELLAVFSDPSVENMKHFWLAEHASGEGKCGGGLIYLVGRAFQQVKDSQLEDRFPDFEEAVWQLMNLIQFQSMNETQRYREARINEILTRYVSDNGTFFKNTFLPRYNNLHKYYGSSGLHSMWMNLPTPNAQHIDGVAYFPPLASLTFLMANGIPVDDIVITEHSPDLNEEDLRRVHNVEDCRKTRDWLRSVHCKYFGQRPFQYEAIVCMHLCTWEDGFDSAKVKANRSSICMKTLTISSPKQQTNGTDNTFPVALGLKRDATGWSKVEERFQEDLEQLTKAKEPLLLYHGTVGKVVPCVFKELVVLSDKQERNGLTGTMACTSDTHRCFSIVGKVETPTCDAQGIKKVLEKEAQGGRRTKYNWCDKYVTESGNGKFLAACSSCRKNTLQKIFGGEDSVILPGPCSRLCFNWDLKGVTYTPHKDYPTKATPGSPVPPPAGRNLFTEELTSLPFLPLNWDIMKQACKFAFYQASRKGQGKHWNLTSTKCYLSSCGISHELSALLYSAARNACQQGQEDNVDYSRPEGIGEFSFHWSWKNDMVSISDFIEAVMHQLFLGAAESNYELIGLWLTSLPRQKKGGMSHAGFLSTLQDLIADLRPYNLSWLMAYPLTGQKKTGLGTGSWVAENWIFFVRISQFLCGWCVRDYKSASQYGVDDMSRMVIAYHGFVGRCLTHGGVTDKEIAEAELYLKEFLSALRELDVRVRHDKHNKKSETQKKGPKKVKEAWWTKSNYLSLSNLISMMHLLGPLVLWWDGGGKGERFIQFVKPFIKQGVREDAKSFFSNLLEKIFRGRQLDLLESRYQLGMTKDADGSNVYDILSEMMASSQQEESPVGEDHQSSEDEEEDTETEDESDDEAPAEVAYFCPNEVHGMTKNRTIFVYRNAGHLEDFAASKKPLAGIVEVKEGLTGEAEYEFQLVYREPKKLFARRRLAFKDSKGLYYHGMWCAPAEMEEAGRIPSFTSFREVQSVAKISAVAIPLRYIIGNDKKDSLKYCVITNWWKYRMEDGTYSLPTLHPKMYSGFESVDLRSLSRRKEATQVDHEGEGEDGVNMAEI